MLISFSLCKVKWAQDFILPSLVKQHNTKMVQEIMCVIFCHYQNLLVYLKMLLCSAWIHRLGQPIGAWRRIQSWVLIHVGQEQRLTDRWLVVQPRASVSMPASPGKTAVPSTNKFSTLKKTHTKKKLVWYEWLHNNKIKKIPKNKSEEK